QGHACEPADPHPHHRNQPGQARPGPCRRRHRLDRQAVRSRKADQRHPSRRALRRLQSASRSGSAKLQEPRRVSPMSDLDDFKATYFDECSELLTELEEQFAAIEAGDHAGERLNAVFRAIHSIKGGAGAFGFSGLVGFAHAYETLLDHMREGEITLSGEVTALCIHANDIVGDFVNAARLGTPLPANYGQSEKARFDALCAGDAEGEPIEEFDIDFTPVRVDLGAEDDAA